MPASRSRLLLALPAALLVAAASALPATAADPGGVPNGGNSDAAHTAAAAKTATKAAAKPKPKPKPHAPNTHAATPSKGKSATAPNNGPKKPKPGNNGNHYGNGNGNGTGGQPAQGAPAPGANGSKLGKVVICKYVRKPGTSEIATHIIVVNANALTGKGFDGVFPHTFSDGQLKSVAIRWAAKGESAREISVSECDAATGTADTPDPTTAGAPVPAAAVPGAPGAVVDNAAPAEVGGVAATARTTRATDRADARDGFLPSTGAGAALLALLVAGAACLVGGGTVLLRHRLRRGVAGI